MKRIMLVVAYDGTNYAGWQKQPNGVSIEEKLNEAISAQFGTPIEVIGASRTDSGVHSSGNIAVFDAETQMPAEKVCYALNSRLPADIVVRESREVPADFHPRHVECAKIYEYRIYCAAHPDPMKVRYSYFVHNSLDVDAMKKAAAFFVGEHDFAGFCSAGSQARTTVRTIYAADVRATDEHEIVIRICGNGFLYNMVRIIAGTLIKVGMHSIAPNEIEGIIASKERTLAGPTAPAQGLRLVEIIYNDLEARISNARNDIFDAK